MEQIPIDFTQPPARARREDPATAHAAAASITPFLGPLRVALVSAIWTLGGATSEEITEATGIQRVSVSPQLRPLQRMGVIRENGTRKGRNGRDSIVWVVECE